MRLNGIETPYEVTLVPLNKIDAVKPQAEVKQTEKRTHNIKKGYSFYCNKFGHFKAEYRKMRGEKWQQTRKNSGQTNSGTGNKTGEESKN